jgi:hypothetical protein
MDLKKLTNPQVRAALEAWQAGNEPAWLALFAPDAGQAD